VEYGWGRTPGAQDSYDGRSDPAPASPPTSPHAPVLAPLRGTSTGRRVGSVAARLATACLAGADGRRAGVERVAVVSRLPPSRGFRGGHLGAAVDRGCRRSVAGGGRRLTAGPSA
jgi:hypothetical protein